MPEPIRCAIYTRKSSEEGLEQSFNSLDAQREACAAFITSQRHEGWEQIPQIYDDGGYSGGNTDRPGLTKLFSDIRTGQVDNIVVYKIDRLTRSLADFAKMVELFDQHKVSFVSVTQQFNTTTSMGRLTLNVLLSFAQFEREVTGERIRDKVAASKAKGMWMGGVVPLGYQLVDKKLIINPDEARLVQLIYKRYLALDSVLQVQREINAAGYRTKLTKSKGGNPFLQDHLSRILTNPLYIGKTKHLDHQYDGQHKSIISLELWAKVQTLRLNSKAINKHSSKNTDPSLLAGRIFDSAKRPMSPSSGLKTGRRYRYYVSQGITQDSAQGYRNELRLPAYDVEQLIIRHIKAWISDLNWLRKYLNPPNQNELRIWAQHIERFLTNVSRLPFYQQQRTFCQLLSSVIIHPAEIEIRLCHHALVDLVNGQEIKARSDRLNTLNIPISVIVGKQGNQKVLFELDTKTTPKRASPCLIRAVVLGQRWRQSLLTRKALTLKALSIETGHRENLVTLYIKVSLLSPKIVESVINGLNPPLLTLRKIHALKEHCWIKQERALGFS